MFRDLEDVGMGAVVHEPVHQPCEWACVLFEMVAYIELQQKICKNEKKKLLIEA